MAGLWKWEIIRADETRVGEGGSFLQGFNSGSLFFLPCKPWIESFLSVVSYVPLPPINQSSASESGIRVYSVHVAKKEDGGDGQGGDKWLDRWRNRGESAVRAGACLVGNGNMRATRDVKMDGYRWRC